MNKTSAKLDPSAAKSWLECKRRAWYDSNPPPGLELVEDRFNELITEQGIAHEKIVLHRFSNPITATSASHTQELINKKTPVIYQPVLEDSARQISGRPDFLILNQDGQYQVADAKLATSLRGHKEIAIQLGVYRQLLGTALPALVYLGSGEVVELGDDDTASITDQFLTDLAKLLANDSPPKAHFSNSKCSSCNYDSLCRPQFIEQQALTLVYGIDSRSLPGLIGQGITTITELANSDPDKIQDVPYLKGKKKHHAVFQAKSYLTGKTFKLRDPELPCGTSIHFDVEQNPLSPREAVYLWGWLEPPYTKEAFRYTWSDGTPEQDRQAFVDFLTQINTLKNRFDQLHLVHFSPFERTQIKKHAELYDLLQDPTVTWLLGEQSPLFDIQKTVTDSLVLPLLGYGLKAICKDPRLVNFQWELGESGSQWSVVRYLDYLKAGVGEKEEIKEEILSYNRDDVRATRAVEEWLRRG